MTLEALGAPLLVEEKVVEGANLSQAGALHTGMLDLLVVKVRAFEEGSSNALIGAKRRRRAKPGMAST